MAEVGTQDDLLVVNGIDAGTGDYLTPRLRLSEVAGSLRGDPQRTAGPRELRRRRQDDEGHLGVVYGRDPDDLAAVGWGVVVPPDLDPAVEEALGPLLRLRQEQAGD